VGRNQSVHFDSAANGLVQKYMNEISEVELLSAEEEKRLFHLFQKSVGDEKDFVRDKLITANLRLVVFCVKRYLGQGFLFLDLVQEGNKGLIRAVDKFDLTMNVRFSTYAVWWIRQAITNMVKKQNGPIGIPINKIDKIRKINRVGEKFFKDKGFWPSTCILAEECAMSVGEVLLLKEYASIHVATDHCPDDDSAATILDNIEDKTMKRPDQDSERAEIRRIIIENLECLTLREQLILKLRYGLIDEGVYTLKGLASLFKVSIERIRQIERQALKKLKKCPQIRDLDPTL
jgi:RNA polymerase primary sigma factor